MKVEHMFPCQTRSALVIVRDYHNGVMEGLLMHPRLEKAQSIQSLSHLLLYLDTLLDLDTCPGSPSPLVHPDLTCTDAIATFHIQVLFRENYSWQGRLVWIEENQEAVFRSDLELMQIMDDILTN